VEKNVLQAAAQSIALPKSANPRRPRLTME
jgi:hypothetical protein